MIDMTYLTDVSSSVLLISYEIKEMAVCYHISFQFSVLIKSYAKIKLLQLNAKFENLVN